MDIRTINPSSLAKPVMDLYSHIAMVPGPGRLVAIAGQAALDAQGNLVGEGDHAMQAEQAFRNLRNALDSTDGGPATLIKYTIHVVNSTPALIEPIFAAAARAFDDDLPVVPSTWLGVQSLALPEWLVEVDGLAVVP